MGVVSEALGIAAVVSQRCYSMSSQVNAGDCTSLEITHQSRCTTRFQSKISSIDETRCKWCICLSAEVKLSHLAVLKIGVNNIATSAVKNQTVRLADCVEYWRDGVCNRVCRQDLLIAE